MKKKIRKYEFGTEDPIDPLTGKPIVSLNGAKNKSPYPSLFDLGNNKAPVNPNADPNQEIFKVQQDPQGVQNKQGEPVPLTQFYDIINSEFGNKGLKGTGEYVNSEGKFRTLEETKAQTKGVSDENLKTATKKYKTKDDIELGSAIGITALNSYLGKQDSEKRNRTNYRKAIEQETFTPIFNPYAEGSGSQAIMKMGGKIKAENGVQIDPPGTINPLAMGMRNALQGGAYGDMQRNPLAFNDGGGVLGDIGAMATNKTSTDPREIAYNTFRSKGINNDSAKMLVAQMMHESTNFTSRVFKTNNNPMGMKVPGKRKSPYIQGVGTLPPSNEGKQPYAKFKSLEDAALDLLEWQKYNNIDVNKIKTPQEYAEVLRQKNYMGETEQAKKIYIAGLTNNMKKIKFETGGKLSGDHAGVQTLDGGKTEVASTSDHSNPMIEFIGNKHTEGGIGINFGGKEAEVQGGEFGYVGGDGALNIFGKTKVPGTSKTFQKMAGDLAKHEAEIDNKKSLYLRTLNAGDEGDKYQESAISTAKVMFKSLDNQSKEIAQTKEAMASYQSLILNLVGEAQQKEFGGQVRPQFATGGKIDFDLGDPADPSTVSKVQKLIDKYSNGKSPLRAEDFIEVSNKYKVPLDLMLAQAIHESNIGTKGAAVRTKNIFNVQNTDEGKREYQSDWKAGLERYAKLMKSEYSTDPNNVNTQDILNNDFVRPKRGGRYATAAYTPAIMKLLKEISPEIDYKGPKGSSVKTPPNDPTNVGKATPPGKGTDRRPKGNANFMPEYNTKEGLWYLVPRNGGTGTGSGNVAGTTGTSGTSGTGITTNENAVEYKFKRDENPGIQTKYGLASREATDFIDKVNIGNGDRAKGYLSPLALSQIAPELITMATNKQDPVYQQTFQPDLKQTFDISYQLGRNENQSSFNQVAKIAESTGNVDALSQLAAQKYKADQQYNMQEVQGNAQQKLGVYGQNIDTLNQAKIQNLQLIADQSVKQAAAKFNTRKEDIAGLTSISAKVLQNDLENKTYNAYSTLFKHYGFDKKGNVTFNPDEVVQKFDEGEAQQFGMLSAQKGAAAILNGDYSRQFTRVKNDDGSTTTTESLGKNKQIQEEYKTLKNQGFDDMIIGNMLRAKYPETISQE